MEELIEDLANGNVTEFKVVLASIVVVLAVYQVLLMAVGYGKLRLPFLKPKPASTTHRSVGDVIVFITVFVAFMCIGYFEIADGIEHADDGETTRVAIHVGAAFALLGVLGVKVLVVRRGKRSGRYLPLLGLTVFTLFVVTWVTSAGDYLWGG